MTEHGHEHEFDVGAFDPVRAFEQTLNDLVEIVEMFDDPNSVIPPLEFLQATKAAGDRLKAISTITLAALMEPVSHKIPADVRDQFQQQIEFENLMATPEDQHKRMMKALRDITSWRKRQL